MITIPSLSDVTDILDTDQVMVTNAQGQSYKIAGSELNKRNKVIIADSTTVTGTPLKAGWPVRIYFTADITAANATTTMQINYNNVNYYVKVPKNGALANYVAFNLGGSPAVFKYVQAYTTLELLFDGTQFIIMCNPVVISGTNFSIYADGLKRVDEVTENGTDLVTSHAVAAAIDKVKDIMSSLPTDAVLHYSFDEVPDYPDGTADVRILDGQTYQIEYGSYAFNANDSNATISNSNGTLVCTINNSAFYLGSAYRNKIFKCQFEITSINGELTIHNGYQNVIKRITEKGIYEITLLNTNEQTPSNIYFYCSGANYSCVFRVLKVYCGDGSYSTPIIDNANGEWNSVSQRGVVVQGVSGKGINIPALTSCVVKADFTLRPPYTHSLWLYIKSFSSSQYAIDGRKSGNDSNTDEGIVILPNGGIETGSNNGGLASVTSSVIRPNVWQHIAISCENINGGNKYTFYINGVKIKEQNTTAVNIGFGELTVGARYFESQVVIEAKVEKTIDDLLIFDRALTENEVMALYLNKANTPKYYPPAQLPS